MKTAYLIYRPVIDYEESETAYLISLTKKEAETKQAELITFGNQIAERLPKCATTEHWKAEEQGRELVATEEEYGDNQMIVWQQRRELLEKIDWPHDIDLSGDIRIHADIASFDESSIQIRELPLV